MFSISVDNTLFMYVLLDNSKKYDMMRTEAWQRSFDFRWGQVLRPTCDWLENMARGETAT